MGLFQDLGLSFQICRGCVHARGSSELSQERLHLGPDLIGVRSGGLACDIVRGGHRAQG